jgi:hypothetical protein
MNEHEGNNQNITEKVVNIFHEIYLSLCATLQSSSSSSSPMKEQTSNGDVDSMGRGQRKRRGILLFEDFHNLVPNFSKYYQNQSTSKQPPSSNQMSTTTITATSGYTPSMPYPTELFHIAMTDYFTQFYSSQGGYQRLSSEEGIQFVHIVPKEDLLPKSLLSLFENHKVDYSAHDKLSKTEKIDCIETIYRNTTSIPDPTNSLVGSRHYENNPEEDYFFSFSRMIYSFSSNCSNNSPLKLKYDSKLGALAALGLLEADAGNDEKNQDIKSKTVTFHHKLYGIESVIEEFEKTLYWPQRYHSLYEEFGLTSSSDSTASSSHILLYGPTGKPTPPLPFSTFLSIYLIYPSLPCLIGFDPILYRMWEIKHSFISCFKIWI